MENAGARSVDAPAVFVLSSPLLVAAAFLLGLSGYVRAGAALGALGSLALSGASRGFIGKDGQPGASKLQLLLWNAAFAYCFLAYWFVVWRFSGLSLPDPPEWLWAAIGVSCTTALAAKGITVSQISRERLQESTEKDVADAKAQPVRRQAGFLISDDDGTPDITRIQMLFWTIIAVAVVVLASTRTIGLVEAAAITSDIAAAQKLLLYPDLDITLLVLAGLGQGVYLGNKLFDSEKPLIVGIQPSVLRPGEPVTILGSGFGSHSDEGQVQVDGVPIELAPLPPASPNNQDVQQPKAGLIEWSDTKIRFLLPESHGGKPWTAGVPVRIRVLVRQVPSANEATAVIATG